MAEAALSFAETARPSGRFLSIRIGWRNLWRNRRRTWLTAGGIAFAILLVVLTMSFQLGMYDVMEENATSLMAGHVQVQSAAYVDDNRFEDTVPNALSVRRRIESTPGVIAVAPRVEAFALVSVDERSFGAQVLGIDTAAEDRTTRFTRMIKQGRGIEGPDDAVLGSLLARNLGADIGGEVVVLGSGKEGGVAALVLNVVGILETGIADLDRGVMLAPIAAVQEGFYLDDEVHSFAIRVADIDTSADVVARIREILDDDALRIRDWRQVLPELQQAIELDRASGQIMYWIIMMLVVFSVVNSFIMTVFERTREFGMLRAIGMRPAKIVLMVLWEAFFLWLIGAAIGLVIASAIVGWLVEVGIYLGEAMEGYATQFYMPSRLHPAFSVEALVTAPVVMFIGTQIGALLPSLRIRHLRPVEALRAE